MKVLANDGISTSGVEVLEKSGFEVITTNVAQEQLVDYINKNEVAVLLVRSATKVRKELIDACPSLKIIGRGGVGMDNIDVQYAKDKGLDVINTPAASSSSVAELVFAHLFGMVRFLHDSNRNMPLEGETNFKKLKKSYSKGKELRGKTLGVIGLGRIGEETVKVGLGMGMKVIGADPFYDGKKTIPFQFFGGKQVDIDIDVLPFNEVLAHADFISLHVPALDKPIIGKSEFDLMKKGAGIVNAARGGVIDEEALLEAIKSEKIAYAGLDVFINEPTPAMDLLMNPSLSLTPHIGGSTVEAQDRIGVELADKIIEILK